MPFRGEGPMRAWRLGPGLRLVGQKREDGRLCLGERAGNHHLYGELHGLGLPELRSMMERGDMGKESGGLDFLVNVDESLVLRYMEEKGVARCMVPYTAGLQVREF